MKNRTFNLLEIIFFSLSFALCFVFNRKLFNAFRFNFCCCSLRLSVHIIVFPLRFCWLFHIFICFFCAMSWIGFCFALHLSIEKRSTQKGNAQRKKAKKNIKNYRVENAIQRFVCVWPLCTVEKDDKYGIGLVCCLASSHSFSLCASFLCFCRLFP